MTSEEQQIAAMALLAPPLFLLFAARHWRRVRSGVTFEKFPLAEQRMFSVVRLVGVFTAGFVAAALIDGVVRGQREGIGFAILGAALTTGGFWLLFRSHDEWQRRANQLSSAGDADNSAVRDTPAPGRPLGKRFVLGAALLFLLTISIMPGDNIAARAGASLIPLAACCLAVLGMRFMFRRADARSSRVRD